MEVFDLKSLPLTYLINNNQSPLNNCRKKEILLNQGVSSFSSYGR